MPCRGAVRHGAAQLLQDPSAAWGLPASRRTEAGPDNLCHSLSNPPGPLCAAPPPPAAAVPDVSIAAVPSAAPCHEGSSQHIPAPWSLGPSRCTTCRWRACREWGRNPGPAPAGGLFCSEIPLNLPRRSMYSQGGCSSGRGPDTAPDRNAG